MQSLGQLSEDWSSYVIPVFRVGVVDCVVVGCSCACAPAAANGNSASIPRTAQMRVRL